MRVKLRHVQTRIFIKKHRKQQSIWQLKNHLVKLLIIVKFVINGGFMNILRLFFASFVVFIASINTQHLYAMEQQDDSIPMDLVDPSELQDSFPSSNDTSPVDDVTDYFSSLSLSDNASSNTASTDTEPQQNESPVDTVTEILGSLNITTNIQQNDVSDTTDNNK